MAWVSAKLTPGAGDLNDDLALAGLGIGELDELHHLGPAELLDSNRFHRRRFSPIVVASLPQSWD